MKVLLTRNWRKLLRRGWMLLWYEDIDGSNFMTLEDKKPFSCTKLDAITYWKSHLKCLSFINTLFKRYGLKQHLRFFYKRTCCYGSQFFPQIKLNRLCWQTILNKNSLVNTFICLLCLMYQNVVQNRQRTTKQNLCPWR